MSAGASVRFVPTIGAHQDSVGTVLLSGGSLAGCTRTLLEATRIAGKDGLAPRYLGEITLQDSATPDPAAVEQLCGFADSHPTNKTANALCGGVLLRVAQENGNASGKAEIL